jgi:ABC-type phosphate transport system substrate-binding protein
MIVEDASLDEWLSTLKPYQSASISQMVAAAGEEEAAKNWLSANGPSSTVGFGGTSNPEPFYERFIEEFRKLICGDEAYEEIRVQLGAESAVAKTIYVSLISTALGATLGYTATLLAPAVAIILHLIGKMSINAWCAAS